VTKYSLRSLYTALLMVLIFGAVGKAAVLEGTVRDLDSGDPIPQATIRVLNTGLTAMANDDGRYRLKLKPGLYNLKFSHIAHYSGTEYVNIPEGDTTVILDIGLKPSTIILKKITAYSKRYGPGERIILEAIKRKQEILDKLKSYTFDAYSKVVASDHSKSAEEILVILESQVQAYWQKPNDFKEVILARRQTANIDAAENLLSVGQLLNFNQNRLDLGRYNVVSPTAEDALDHYNYYLADTLYFDGAPVFRLEIEPKNETEPLFAGTIDIADSTYEVVGVDVTFSKGFDTRFMKDIRYTQTYAEFQNEIWMPVEIRFTALLKLGIPAFPDIDVDYAATLHNYTFTVEEPERVFDGYVIEVAPDADAADTLIWARAQITPLTEYEKSEYNRIDSVENAPKPLAQQALIYGLGAVFVAMFEPSIFHFSRVEGAYLGLPLDFKFFNDRLTTKLETGYAFDAKLWQHRYGLEYRLNNIPEVSIGGEYRKQVTKRTVLHHPFADLSNTAGALYDGHDPDDYYLKEGFTLNIKGSPVRKTRVELSYNDYLESSLAKTTDFTLDDWFDSDKNDSIVDHRDNPAIMDGRLRSVGANFSWDNRPLIKDKGIVKKLPITEYTAFGLGIEVADPDLIDNDFEFTRMTATAFRRQRFFNLGITNIFVTAGWSDKFLPPQHYFTQDFGEGFMISRLRFKTLGNKTFLGDRAVSFYVDHNFGRTLFMKSGIPLVKDIPFSLGVHGGGFLTRFEHQPGIFYDEHYLAAKNWYREFGFSITGITIFDIGVYFTWQLSDYNTNDFSVNMNMGLLQF